MRVHIVAKTSPDGDAELSTNRVTVKRLADHLFLVLGTVPFDQAFDMERIAYFWVEEE